MRRQVWAWPVGIVGNLLLFTVFVGGILDKPQANDLWGQAGRQVFFLAVSVYGWWRWSRSRRLGESADAGAIVPRWAGAGRAAAARRAAVVGTTVFYFVLRELGSWGPLPDAWILTGSILATYGMARGWIEFWLIWIAVDVVGVPLLFQAGYYPSAVLYLVYGGLCVVGFVTWLRTKDRAAGAAPPEPSADEVVGMTRPQVRLDTVERAIADIAAGQGGGRGRRRGPRERGRPDLRRQQVHAGADGVHDPLQLRGHLRADGGRDAGPARHPADDAAQPGPAPHGVHRLGRRPRRRHHRASRPPTARTPCGCSTTPPPSPSRSPSPGTCSRCATPTGGVLRPARPHRGGGRPGPARRADPGRRDLRDRQRRRHDEAGPGPARLRRRARPRDDLHRGPDPLPAPPREPRRAGRRDPAADPGRRSSPPTATG